MTGAARTDGAGRRAVRVRAVAVAVGLALLPFVATRAVAEERRVLTAVVPRHWPPQYSVDETGRPEGFAIAVFDAIAERAGFRVQYRLEESWPEALEVLRRGDADVIPNLGVIAQRDAWLAFTAPVETFDVSLFVREGTPGLERPADLAGRTVAVVQENVGASLRLDPEMTRVVMPNVHEAVFALLGGSVDALVYPTPVVRALLREAGMEGRLRTLGPSLAEVKRAVAVRDDDPELLALLDRAVREFAGTPAYRALYVAWHTPPRPFWTARRVGWAAGGGLFLVLAGMVAWRHLSLLRVHRHLRAEIRERSAAEAALREEQRRLRSVKESLGEGLILTDREGRIVDVNRRMTEMLGTSREELLGRFAPSLAADAEVQAEGPERLARRLAGKDEHYETRMRRRDGGALWVEIHGTPLRAQDGRVIGALAAINDLTRRKQAEEALRQRDEELRSAQRLEALGRLAGGVAHDFNNLLTAVLGHAETLRERARSDEERDAAEQIQRAAEQAASLTSRLLTFGRRQVRQVDVFELDALVEETRSLLARVIGEDVRLEVHADAPGARVRADRAQLAQVIVNLALNARDAMPRGGRLAIRTRPAELDEATAAAHVDARPGPHVLLEVSDTGEGIDPDALPHIFEPFFTTKESGQGTGLGLATVYGAVRQSGGHLEVRSAPGEGACFRILLPRSDEAVTPRPAPDATRSAPGGDACILLAEDESAVRRLAARMLRDAGYRVVEATSGDDALARAHALGPGALDLVVTDVVMPGLGGDELARRLHEEDPALPILFLSGYAAGERLPDLLADGARLLPKPFRAAELQRAVREVLDAARPRAPAGAAQRT